MKKYSIVILVGGFGSRLEKISNGIPKALMPIGDSLFIDLILNEVSHYNIDNIYLSIHYKSDLFVEYANKSKYNNLINIIEPLPMGTGGAIKYVIENSDIKSPFFVINGDTLSSVNLNKMMEIFLLNNYKAMIGVSKHSDSKRYGSVSIDNGKIVSFNEKQKTSEGWINNGHYIFDKSIFKNSAKIFSIEKDMFPRLVKKEEVAAFEVPNDKFIDMGIPKDYKLLCEMQRKDKLWNLK